MTGSCVLRVVWRVFILPLQRAQELSLTVSCQKKKKKAILCLVDQKSQATFV